MAKKTSQKVKGCKKCGRSQRSIRYPLMPDKLTPRQAWWWYNTKYEK